ncbi:D-amino-acid dehydrogenase [Litchfieldella qijiaojingensis]|uniref:D-amino-acid dehydrogenase n=1 Tax=Litchfieldella qijiaojingensis TaxID=980347 RepID=A0ABQ2YKC7_9GAMM|nr:FAD-binding oxidoreductase [Halomonas qijiaojingensis]GGX85225.1 D-amino-acid dehydrogenase [Halomonas qijiaojingensis]
MTRDTIVLGAGMVGTSIAFHLARRGRSVVLVDRRAPGKETSFGNAGIIQREAVRPHAFPRDMATLLRVLPNRRIDIRYRPQGMLAAAGPLWEYWRHSAPHTYAVIVPEYASLIMRCTEEHQAMIEAAGVEALVRKEGWLEGFRTQRVFDEQLAIARDNEARFGVTYQVLDSKMLKAKEPHLSDELIGAIHWTNAWTVVDPGGLVQAYAQAFEALGGHIEQAEAQQLEQTASGWRLTTTTGSLEAEEVVLAAGPWSQRWLRPLGYRLPMFPKRGYHMHYAMRDVGWLHHWLMDFESGFLLAPMQAGIRLTTGAELTTLEGPARHGQLDAAEVVARRLLPLGERRDPEPWRGNRPCMPDMKPVIGPASRHAGLWFAFGHGHQGFTLGPVTGRLIGEMMDGEPPAVDMAPFRAERFADA